MSDLIETIKYRGYEIEVVQDQDAQSPKDWGSDDCFLIYDHRDFTVEVKGFDPAEIFDFLTESKGKRSLFPVLTYAKRPIGLDADAKIESKHDYYHVFPVYAYIHSGVSLSLGRNRYPFNDRWDTSFKGFALVKRMKKWSWTEAKARKIAESIVKEWNDYLSGNVYGYIVKSDSDDHIDSCWGYYGDYKSKNTSSLLEGAENSIDCLIQSNRKKHYQQLKTWIKSHVPFHYRQPLTAIA